MDGIRILSPSVSLARVSIESRRRRAGQGRPSGWPRRTLDALAGRDTLLRARGQRAPCSEGLPDRRHWPPLAVVRRTTVLWLGASHVSRPGKPRRHQGVGRRPRARATAGHCSLGLAGGRSGRELQTCNFLGRETTEVAR